MYWKKGFFSSTYKLFEDEQQLGQLKEKAFSSTATGNLEGVELEFKKSGFFNEKATIVDLTLGEQLGEIKFKSWGSKADLTLAGKSYKWKYTNIWNSKWSLCNAKGESLIDYHGKFSSGKITLQQKDEALLLTGLYIHNYNVQMMVIIVVIVTIVIL